MGSIVEKVELALENLFFIRESLHYQYTVGQLNKAIYQEEMGKLDDFEIYCNRYLGGELHLFTKEALLFSQIKIDKIIKPFWKDYIKSKLSIIEGGKDDN